MANIRSHVPFVVDPAAEAPCVWCLGPTDIRAETPFRPDLGRVPLHLFCGADVIDAFNRFKASRTLSTEDQQRMMRLAAPALTLPAGVA